MEWRTDRFRRVRRLGCFYDGTDFGWRFFTHAFRHELERHRGTPRTLVSVRRRARGGPAVPWVRVWGAEGFAPGKAVTQFTLRQPFEVRLGRERLLGKVDNVRAPSGFFGTLASLEDATLLWRWSQDGEELACGLWLSSYGLPAERVQLLQQGLTDMADRAFASIG